MLTKNISNKKVDKKMLTTLFDVDDKKKLANFQKMLTRKNVGDTS
jgi:hypothetical protein